MQFYEGIVARSCNYSPHQYSINFERIFKKNSENSSISSIPIIEIENWKNPSKTHPNPANNPKIRNNTAKNFNALIIMISAYWGITFSFQWSLILLADISFAKLANFSYILCTKASASIRMKNSIATTQKRTNTR